MDWIIWVIVIVVIVGVVWWLLNRNSSGNTTGPSTLSDTGASVPPSGQAGSPRPVAGAPAGGSAAPSADAAATAGMPGAAGFSSAAKAAPATSAPAGGDVDDWDEDSTATTEAPAAATDARAPSNATVKPAGTAEPEVTAQPEHAAVPGKEAVSEKAAVSHKAEWEAQWSEAASTPHAAETHAESHTMEAPAKESAGESRAAWTGTTAPVHHPEYTEPHAPTLPGAESAAAEDVLDTAVRDKEARESGAGAELPPAGGTGPAVANDTGVPSEGDAETMQAASSSAATEGAASHTAEPAGHLAADKPYGEGSAAPAPDGSAPDGYTVKGNAQQMVYHDETSPAYEETVAEVWFESAAHAEAAGFRAPRRSRH